MTLQLIPKRLGSGGGMFTMPIQVDPEDVPPLGVDQSGHLTPLLPMLQFEKQKTSASPSDAHVTNFQLTVANAKLAFLYMNKPFFSYTINTEGIIYSIIVCHDLKLNK